MAIRNIKPAYFLGANLSDPKVYGAKIQEIIDLLNGVSGDLTISGTATFNGNVVIGSDATDTLTINATVVNFSGANAMVFEGATANGFEATIAIADPTADSVYTIPDVGTSSFVMTAGTQSVGGDKTFTGAVAVTKAAGAVGISIDAGTTDSTVDVIDINLDVNSASVNAIDISTDVGTALSAGELVKSVKIDTNALAADADTSEIYGVDITASTVSTSRADIKGVKVTTDGTMDTADTIYGVEVQLDNTKTGGSESAGVYVNSNVTLNHASETHFGLVVDIRDVVNTSSSELAALKVRLEDDGKGLQIDAATVDHAAGNLIDIDADAKDIVSGSLKGANINIDETVAGTNGTAIYGTEWFVHGDIISDTTPAFT